MVILFIEVMHEVCLSASLCLDVTWVLFMTRISKGKLRNYRSTVDNHTGYLYQYQVPAMTKMSPTTNAAGIADTICQGKS